MAEFCLYVTVCRYVRTMHLRMHVYGAKIRRKQDQDIKKMNDVNMK